MSPNLSLIGKQGPDRKCDHCSGSPLACSYRGQCQLPSAEGIWLGPADSLLMKNLHTGSTCPVLMDINRRNNRAAEVQGRERGEGQWRLIPAPGPSPNQMWIEGAGLGGLNPADGGWLDVSWNPCKSEPWSLSRVCNLESRGLPPFLFFFSDRSVRVCISSTTVIKHLHGACKTPDSVLRCQYPLKQHHLPKLRYVSVSLEMAFLVLISQQCFYKQWSRE